MYLPDVQGAISAGYVRVGGHAIHEGAADGLLIAEIWSALLGPATQIIEEYPQDPRGPSCLVYG